MAPLVQGKRCVSSVRDVQGEWGGVIWHPNMEILTQEMVVPLAMVAVGVCVSSEGVKGIGKGGAFLLLCTSGAIFGKYTIFISLVSHFL